MIQDLYLHIKKDKNGFVVNRSIITYHDDGSVSPDYTVRPGMNDYESESKDDVISFVYGLLNDRL
jgi:hypothetical protein